MGLKWANFASKVRTGRRFAKTIEGLERWLEGWLGMAIWGMVNLKFRFWIHLSGPFVAWEIKELTQADLQFDLKLEKPGWYSTRSWRFPFQFSSQLQAVLNSPFSNTGPKNLVKIYPKSKDLQSASDRLAEFSSGRLTDFSQYTDRLLPEFSGWQTDRIFGRRPDRIFPTNWQTFTKIDWQSDRVDRILP